MLCPQLTAKSALFWISIIQIVVYIITLSLGGIYMKSFLAINPTTLEDMGQKVSIILDMVIPMLLRPHANVYHLARTHTE